MNNLENHIIKCLQNSEYWDWGCLNTKGELFTIKTLSKIKIPGFIITQMIKKGKIYLGEDDYYHLQDTFLAKLNKPKIKIRRKHNGKINT